MKTISARRAGTRVVVDRERGGLCRIAHRLSRRAPGRASGRIRSLSSPGRVRIECNGVLRTVQGTAIMRGENRACRTCLRTGIEPLSHFPVALEISAANTILEALGHSRQSGPLHVSICLPATGWRTPVRLHAASEDGYNHVPSPCRNLLVEPVGSSAEGSRSVRRRPLQSIRSGRFGAFLRLKVGTTNHSKDVVALAPKSIPPRSTRHIVLAYAGDSASACLLMGPALAQADGKSRSQ